MRDRNCLLALGENTGKCLDEVTMIGFVPVDSPNCPGAGDDRNL